MRYGPRKLKEINYHGNGMLFYASKSKRWCEQHPMSVWGDGYIKCAEGFRKNEDCKEGR